MQAASAVPRIVVVGGNGYLGSAICKAAIAKGWQVDSISPSGTPSLTPAGHARRWTTDPRMRWHKASAFEPREYAHLLGSAPAAASVSSSFSGQDATPTASTSSPAASPAPTVPPAAVIHTLGILLEADYKAYVRSGDVVGLARAVLGGGEGNPLAKGRSGKGKERMSYDRMNRESALAVLSALRDALGHSGSTLTLTACTPGTTDPATPPRTPFVYISAEDVFPAPLVPRGYVESKRAAEREIAAVVAGDRVQALLRAGPESEGQSAEVQGRIRPVFIRPGLMYHPHIRPLSTPLAVLLDITSTIHTRMSSLFPGRARTASPLPPPTASPPPPGIRSTLATPPIHVDHVAAAVLRAVEDPAVEGVVRTRTMRAWAGWDDEVGQAVYDEGEAEGGRRGNVVV